MPLPTELEDRFVVMANQHSEDSWCQQVCGARDFLGAVAQTKAGEFWRYQFTLGCLDSHTA